MKKLLADNKISVDEYNARSRRLSAEAAWLRADKYQPGGSNGGNVGGYEVITETENHYDDLGRRTGTTTKKKRTGSGGKKTLPNAGNSGNSGNTGGKKKLPGQN